MVAGNMLVTFRPNQKGHAENEIRSRLNDVNAYVDSIEHTNVEGVCEIRVLGDPKDVVADLKKLCFQDPEQFPYTHHWVPIEKWVEPYMEEMLKVMTGYGETITANERWMLHLHKRHIGKHSSDIIEKLTAPINKGIVDLENPQTIVIVELMGNRAGMSLVRSEELLDVIKVRELIERRML
ncbi:MAG: THUMP domain-containing protein [Methanomassiliicoccales archaeon]|jgi:tRNA acetyltransferase TAN1